MKKQRLGIDVGKVIIGGAGEEDTSFFSDDFLLTPEVKNAFTSIKFLAGKYDIWIISKCGQKVQDRTLLWLEARGFFGFTGVSKEQVLFVRKRPAKAPLAVELGLIAFLDDRDDIIESMNGLVQHPILFKTWEQTLHDLAQAGL